MIQENTPKLVNENKNFMFTFVPSAEDIHMTVVKLKSDSAPGHAGFGASFFQHYQEINKIDVINVVTQFFL